MSNHIHRSKHTSFHSKSLILLATIIGFSMPSVGYSLDITVNSSADAPQVAGNTSTCVSTSADRQCTLRAAIQLANSTIGSDTITLNSDVHLEQTGSFENAGKTGDLDISLASTTISMTTHSTTMSGMATRAGRAVALAISQKKKRRAKAAATRRKSIPMPAAIHRKKSVLEGRRGTLKLARHPL